MMHGEYGIDDVCLSTLTLVGPNGVQGKVPMRMTKAEIEQLKKSADALKEIIAQIDLNYQTKHSEVQVQPVLLNPYYCLLLFNY